MDGVLFKSVIPGNVRHENILSHANCGQKAKLEFLILSVYLKTIMIITKIFPIFFLHSNEGFESVRHGSTRVMAEDHAPPKLSTANRFDALTDHS